MGCDASRRRTIHEASTNECSGLPYWHWQQEKIIARGLLITPVNCQYTPDTDVYSQLCIYVNNRVHTSLLHLLQIANLFATLTNTDRGHQFLRFVDFPLFFCFGIIIKAAAILATRIFCIDVILALSSSVIFHFKSFTCIVCTTSINGRATFEITWPKYVNSTVLQQ